MHSYYGAVALISIIVIHAQLLQCCDLDKYNSDIVIHAQLLQCCDLDKYSSDTSIVIAVL